MNRTRVFILCCLAVVTASAALAQAARRAPLVGREAYGDVASDAPGVRRLIRPTDLPSPLASEPASNPAREVLRPAGTMPKAPPGFRVELVASGLQAPRVLRVAPNGDLFVAETRAGRVLVSRPTSNGKFSDPKVFAQGLRGAFGIAFGPPGAEPQWIYIATTTEVVRLPYASGDLEARGKPEPILRNIPGGGHSTRDLAFSPDGKTLFVSVGSASNVAEDMPRERPRGGRGEDPEVTGAMGATWGPEERRADVLAVDPNGGPPSIFATGLRNCAGLATEPSTGDLWCVVNERDLLGDDLPPDYATRVAKGGFYGWPWYYIGNHEDPRLKGARPDLAGKALVPDVLIQPHSAPLQIAFYGGTQFPESYRGSAFVALHGSWNRARRTGYKVVRLEFENGKATGVYEDFLTGFVSQGGAAWGRPVGVAVAKDGSLLVGEDASGTIWRVSRE